jgi:hypothetical protein
VNIILIGPLPVNIILIGPLPVNIILIGPLPGENHSLVSYQSKKFSLFGHRVGEFLKCKSFSLVRS